MSFLAALLLAMPLAAASRPPLPNTNRVAARAAAAAKPRRRRAKWEKEEQYEILPAAAILERMQRLAADYPAFATLTTAQEWFDVPRAGGEHDCRFDKNYKVSGNGCNTYVLILQDKEAYPDDSDVQLADNADYFLELEEGWFKTDKGESGDRSGWKYVPDVFLSGAVHGNERVAPTSLLEMAELLVEAAHCESLPRMRNKPATTNGTSAEEETWMQELSAAQDCRKSLAEEKGIPSQHRRWLARLVATRRTIVVPSANALGYSRDEREEAGIDPNRDFPFDILPEDRSTCMQTTAGRTINELFRSHLFPIGLTFHGGMEVVAYEWGAPTYLNKDAPDAIAQGHIAGAYSRYANGFHGHRAYDFGTMNDKVYYVRGGMEDWAFAGSWDPDRVVECAPTTFGGYPAEKTKYNNSTLRTFNMLVETSSPKVPARKDLGKRNNPLDSTSGEDNGHIARNIRLALVAMDVVEPYVSIREVGGLELEDEVIPGVNSRRYGGKSYFDNGPIVWVPGDAGNSGGGGRKMGTSQSAVTISWTIGGAFNIDETELIFGPWDALPTNLADLNDGAYPSVQTMSSINNDFASLSPSNIDGSTAGRSRWHAQGPYPTSSDGINPAFEATIDTSAFPPGTNIGVIAKAKVDKSWLVAASNVGPEGLGPVSHIVNSRGNPNYFASNAGKVIRGRKDDWWYSAPITLVVGGSKPEEAEQVVQEAEANHAPISFMAQDARGGDVARAVHLNARIGYLPHSMETVVAHPKGSGWGAPTTKSLPFLLGSLAGAIFVLLILVGLVRRRRKRYARQRLEHIAEAESDSFSVNSYSDHPGGEEEDIEVPVITKE